jgi:alpha-beta hydrolase superfamily lysophospholipase
MSSYNSFQFETGKGLQVSGWSVIPESPAAVLHILHGMMEHSARYREFADWLAGKGIAVFSADHPGHGTSIHNREDLGHLDDGNGWKLVSESVMILQEKIREAHPDLKVFMLGHSFGSVVARSFVQRYTSKFPLAGLILSGAMQQSSFLLGFGLLLTALLKVLHGQHYRSKLMITLGHGQYAKFFAPNRSSFDWLSSDQKTVDDYVNDPLCGYACSLGYYRNFFRALLETWHGDRIREIPSQLPVLFLGGSLDPAIQFGKDTRLLSEKYSSKGLGNVMVKLYKSGRHEMLNEVNRIEVWEDIWGWMRKNYGS